MTWCLRGFVRVCCIKESISPLCLLQAKSSYDFQFAKPQLKWLFRDYNRADARSLVYFSPPEDPRVSITARIGASMEQPGKNSHGMAQRW